MPTIRYEVRNEYGLADPELHRAADKDDPEAVLEGVAMAGLVGVLRQLGDLAEFAAEIFHDLHEEVMCTAARGHGLMLRVQQLEAEFPSLEKAFFSKSNHSNFTYNDGTDWHANIQINQNLVTQGDMPRFILDSYEECRGPPRLFMLDKFDIAGAGACLKRYSDPSFFKMEQPSSSGMTEVNIPREKRARKMKKKGSRWKNGKTLESLLSPNTGSSLQLATSGQASEKPATRLVRLKSRCLNRDIGRSLMGRLLELHSDMQKIVLDTSRSHLNRKLEMINSSEQESVLHDIGIDKSISHPVLKDENAMASNYETPILLPTYNLEYKKMENELSELPPKAAFGVEETDNNGNLAEQNKILADSEIKSGCNVSHDEFGYPDKGDISEMTNQVLYDSEINLESSGDGYKSDDIGSEQENFMDALNTMEYEVETDSDSKRKLENFNKEVDAIEFDSVEDLEQLITEFSEQHHVENFPVHMNSTIINGLSDSASSDTLSHVSKTQATKELFFSSNQDQNLAIDLGEPHNIIYDEICPKPEVATSVNLNTNNIHDIEIYDHSGSTSEPEEAPCDSFPTELISVPSFHPQECSDEQLSHAAVENDISASYNKQSEGETIINGCSHMNNQDPKVPLSTEHVSDLVSEITTENVEMSTHLSATCEVSEIMSETVEMSSNLSPTCESFTENHQSECSLFTLGMPTVREMWESNDQDLEASMSDGKILSAIPLLDNGNAVAPQSCLVIAEIQHTLPLAYPFSDITSNNVRETNDASNDILNSSLGTEVEHEDENCYAEHHAEALVPEVVEIRQNLPDHLPVLKNEVNEEVSVVYNEDVSNPLTMQERESQEVANEDATIRCRLPDHLLDMEDEDKKEVVLGYDEDFSLRPTMPERESQEVLNEDMAIRCGISDQIPYIKDEDNKEVYLEYDDISFPSTMQERESHEVLNDEDMAIKCDMSDHRPDMKHEDNGNVPVKYSEDIALPLTMQERESREACDEDTNTFSNIGLSSDLSAFSTVDAENVISEENLSNDGSSFNIVLMNEMPDNNAAKIPDLAHISDTKLQPTNRMNFEEKERMPCADGQRHLESNSSDMSGYPMLLDGHLESENEYTGYDSEKEIKQIEQNFLSDEVSCGIVSVEDESRGSAHLDPSSGSSPDISSSRKQSDEDCVSSSVTSHHQDLKVVETYNQKDADLLDSQRIPDINSSSSEKPESGSTALDSELFAKDLSSDKDVAFASCISDSQTESLSTVKKSFSDDSLERKHGHCATSLEQNPCGSIEEISSYIKFFPANPPEEAPKVEFRCEEDVTTILDEHFEQKILTNSTGFYDSIPPSGPSNDDADSDNRNLDMPSSKWNNAKKVESDAFTASTNDSENLAGSVTSDLSTVVLPQFPRLSVLSSKSTMAIPNDNESDQSSACLPLTDMEDPPPLPPLPPIGWRTGKLHEKTQSSYFNPVQHVPEACSLVPSSATEYRPALEGGRRVQPADQFADMKKLEIKSFQHGLLTSDSEHILPLRLSQLPPILHDEMDQHDQFLLADTYMNSSHILSATPTVQYEKSLHDPNALSELKSHPADAITQFTIEDKIAQQLPSLQQEKVKSLDERTSQIEQVLPTPEPERLQDSQHGNANLDKELMHHQNLSEAQSTVEDEAYRSYQGICSGDDVDIRSLEPQCTPVLEVCHPGYVVLVEQNLSNHYGVIWATEAERQGVRPSSVRNRPRNPLIDAVAAHDRSTMRKVAELVRPPIYMSDERDSLLEQIRNKAFSLKPATSTKQNMKAPPTNLKVAAIIEKANAIRQACAGSDEDDDADSWSDS